MLFTQGRVLFAQGLLHFERGSAKLHDIKAEKDRSGGTPASRRVPLRDNLTLNISERRFVGKIWYLPPREDAADTVKI